MRSARASFPSRGHPYRMPGSTIPALRVQPVLRSLVHCIEATILRLQAAVAGQIHFGGYMYRESFWKRPQAILLAAALVVGLAGAGFAAASHIANQYAALELKLAAADEAPSRTGFASVVKKALPSVVNISSSKVSKTPAGFFEQMPDDPMFRQFFGRDGNGPRQTPQQREKALGSGVIMTSDGYLLTNNHVVDGATDVRVTLGDKREFKAKVVGTDPKSDIAVLKIDATRLPAISVANSARVEVGDYALAIGDPFGVGQTVTMGIVSAT